MRRGFGVFAALVLAVLCGYAGVAAARFAWAEWLSRGNTVEDFERAAHVTPDNAQYYGRIAALDPTRQSDLDAALQRNPRDPSLWILQSVREEEDGDLSAAEESLLRATRVARYYVPRWSLAAFYFRQQNRAKFVEAARGALSVGYGDGDSLVRMAQRLRFTSDEILATILPDDAGKLESYLRLLLGESDLAAVQATTLRLIAVGLAKQAGPALDACDVLFSSGRLDQSIQIWNKLTEAGWIRRARLDSAGGISLANSRFGAESLGRGFDWRIANVTGIATSQDDSALRLEFSGKQPETCDLVSQHIVLNPDRRYRLTVRYRVESITAGAGLSVAIRSLPGGSFLWETALRSAASDWHDESFEFRAPRQAVPLEIVVAYSRSLGTTRIEGRLWIESIHLQPIT